MKTRDDQEQHLPAKERWRILLSAYYVVGMAQACGFAYITLMPYVLTNYGASPATMGYVNSAGALGQLFISPQLGRLGDSRGARAVMLLGCVSMATAHLTTGLAWGVPMILLGRILAIGQDPKPGAQMLVVDLVEGQHRSVAMGKLALPMSLGMFMGPVLGGQIARLVGEQNAFLVSWLGPLSSCLLLMVMVPSQTRSTMAPAAATERKAATAKQKNGFVTYFKNENIRFLLTIKLITSVPFLILAQNMAIIGLTTFKLSPQMNGIVLSWNGIVNMLLSAFVFGKLTKTFTDDQLLRIAPIVSLVAYMLISQMTSVWIMMVAIVPWNLANVVVENQVVARITRLVPPAETGAIVGVNASIFHFSRIIGPFVGGLIIQHLGVQAIGYFGLAVSLFLIVYCNTQEISKGHVKQN